MRRIIAIALLTIAGVPLAHGQVGTTTEGPPLTIAGVPLYGIAENGDLFWLFHQGADNGSANWANQGQRKNVGSAWNEGLRVFKGSPRGEDGVIYRVDSRGDLIWFKHVGHATGAPNWIGPKTVGHGWQDVRIAFAAGDGVIYAINKSGELLWFRHLGYGDGSATWANDGIGAKVGVGWGGVRMAFAGGGGIIYAIDGKGDLYWYRHLGHTDGTFTWANGAVATKVGNGWAEAASAFSGGKGVIYALKRDGNLYWYNHTGAATGAATWTPPGTGNRIGTGWGEMVRIF
ncbi:MAG TPA: tachylectin-related carbohydrate-binding protein [Gemmatimonadales bacterium]|jgi:hypothetical protein|nr:tachylectin-related carbohydrate-binding protein [Gemmatimonadales bacterium]